MKILNHDVAIERHCVEIDEVRRAQGEMVNELKRIADTLSSFKTDFVTLQVRSDMNDSSFSGFTRRITDVGIALFVVFATLFGERVLVSFL